MKINQLITETKAQGGYPIRLDKIIPDAAKANKGQKNQYRYSFIRNNRPVALRNDHNFYKLSREDREKLLRKDPQEKKVGGEFQYPRTLYTAVLNINGKNPKDGTAVFDLETFSFKVNNSIDKSQIGQPVVGLTAEELWKQISPRLDATGTDAEFKRKQGKLLGKQGKIAQYMSGQTGKYGVATRKDPTANAFDKLFVSGGLRAMDKMGLFGDPNAMKKIELDGDIKTTLDPIIQAGQGQILHQLLGDLQRVFDKTQKDFKSSAEYQAMKDKAEQDPTYKGESVNVTEAPSDINKWDDEAVAKNAKTEKPFKVDQELGGPENERLDHVAKELAYNDGVEFDRYQQEYLKRAYDLSINDPDEYNGILSRPPSMPGEQPEYGDQGYDNPNDPKKSQAYQDAMSQGTQEIAQIFGNIDNIIQQSKIKVSNPDLLKDIVKTILSKGQLFPAYKYIAKEYPKYNKAALDRATLTKKDYETWVNRLNLFKDSEPEKYKELLQPYNGAMPTFAKWKAQQGPSMPTDPKGAYYNPNKDLSRVGDRKLSAKDPDRDKYQPTDDQWKAEMQNKVQYGRERGLHLQYQANNPDSQGNEFPDYNKWLQMKGLGQVKQNKDGTFFKSNNPNWSSNLSGAMFISHKFIDPSTNQPIKVTPGKFPELDKASNQLVDLNQPELLNKHRNKIVPGAFVFHIGGKNSGKPGQPIKAQIKNPVKPGDKSAMLVSQFNKNGYSTPLSSMKLQIGKAVPKGYKPRTHNKGGQTANNPNFELK